MKLGSLETPELVCISFRDTCVHEFHAVFHFFGGRHEVLDLKCRDILGFETNGSRFLDGRGCALREAARPMPLQSVVPVWA
jgi:hypothetical protein